MNINVAGTKCNKEESRRKTRGLLLISTWFLGFACAWFPLHCIFFMFQNPHHLCGNISSHGSLRSDDDSQPDEIFLMVLFVPMTPNLDSCTKNQQHGDNQPGGLLWAYDCSGTWVLWIVIKSSSATACVTTNALWDYSERERITDMYILSSILLSNQNLITFDSQYVPPVTLTSVSDSGFQFHQIWYKNQTGFRWFWISIGMNLSRIYSK